VSYYRSIYLTLIVLMLSSNVLVRAQTPETALKYYNQGVEKFGRGEHDAAIEDFTKAIEISSRLVSEKHASRLRQNANGFNTSAESGSIKVIDPFTAKAYTNRGVVRYEKGDVDGAIDDFNNAIEINPGLAAPYSNRGTARRLKGDLRGALADFDRSLTIDRRLVEAYNNRGTLRQDLGDSDGALADLNQAIALNPRLAEAYYHRGYLEIDRKDFRQAILDFDRAIKLKPGLDWAYQGRGTARMNLGDLDGAIADFSRALKLNPNEVAYTNRGLALLLQGKDLEAQKDFEKLLAMAPGMKADLDGRIKLAKEVRQTH